MAQKATLLFLGASENQLPPIRYAKQRGYRIITCDNRPTNPGHALADVSVPVSTTNLDAVLSVGRTEAIDGIVAYASDPAAPTAAYVAEQLNLPGNPYESVRILAEKDLFREFLRRHGFNAPTSESFIELRSATAWFRELSSPAFVKPVDSSGSKGVSRCDVTDDFRSAFEHAQRYSRSGRVIIETEIDSIGAQVAGDGFVVDGTLAYRAWANENFNQRCNGLVPIGQTFPTSHSNDLVNRAESEFQRLLSLLEMQVGALNFDFVFRPDRELQILELGPRNGGCRIPEAVKYWDGVDMIAATVEAAIGNSVNLIPERPRDAFWATYVIHSTRGGQFAGIDVAEELQDCVIELDVSIRLGDAVRPFFGSDDTIGSAILRFDTQEQMESKIREMDNLIAVKLEGD